MKDNSSKIVEQNETLAKRVRNLENEMTKEKTERADDTAALQARIDTVESDLKAKIRQVASEHTVMLLSPKIVKKPHAVHVGQSQLSIAHVSTAVYQSADE